MTDDEFFALKGHAREVAKTICVDFDGVLYPRTAGMMESPAPIAGAVATMQMWHAQGHRLVVWSSRLAPEWLTGHRPRTRLDQIEYITRLLHRDAIPYNYITANKVPAAIYLDDNALRFDGSWGRAAQEVQYIVGGSE